MEDRTEVETNDNFIYIERFWPNPKKNESNYDRILRECQSYFSQGDIMMFGRVVSEKRMTCLMSNIDTKMSYSGRQVQPHKIESGTLINHMMKMLRKQSFRKALVEMNPELKGIIPKFNAVFVNHYRPPTDEIQDSLGSHSDDEKSLASQVILSVTFCQESGERLFRFVDKKTNAAIWEKELPNGSGLWMLPGCQQRTKHEVSGRKTHLDGSRITGGRINLTFRMLSFDDKPIFFCKISEPHGEFSNWYTSPFVEDDIEFRTVEHYMMYHKAKLMGDETIMQSVLGTDNPATVKALGRKVKNFDADLWSKNCYQIVLRGNILKFQNHPQLKAKLLATGENTIAEAADYDKIWGIGLNAAQARKVKPSEWKGQNLLGEILMEVRSTLS